MDNTKIPLESVSEQVISIRLYLLGLSQILFLLWLYRELQTKVVVFVAWGKEKTHLALLGAQREPSPLACLTPGTGQPHWNGKQTRVYVHAPATPVPINTKYLTIHPNTLNSKLGKQSKQGFFASLCRLLPLTEACSAYSMVPALAEIVVFHQACASALPRVCRISEMKLCMHRPKAASTWLEFLFLPDAE